MSFPVDSSYVAPVAVPDDMTAAGHLCLHRDGHRIVVTKVAGDVSHSPGLFWLASVTRDFIPWDYRSAAPAVAAGPVVAAVPEVVESYKGTLHYFFCLLGDCFCIDDIEAWLELRPFSHSIKVEALERMALRVQARLQRYENPL